MLPWVVLCVYGALAPADGPVYVGVAARDADLEVRAERAAIALGQAFEKRGAVDLGSPPLPDTSDGKDAILAGAVAAARARYLEGDFAAAQSRADDAIERFESSGAFRPGPAWTEYAEALVIRALALRRLGKEADADAALMKLVVVMPDAVPDPEITPPRTAQRHQQLQAELRGKPRVQIEITSTPEGAEVHVDGRPAGHAPVVVRDLLPGTHFVALAAEGERVEKKVTAASGTARVDERVGDPLAVAARELRASLGSARAAGITSSALLEKARTLGDDIIVGALAPGPSGDPLLVLARTKGDALSVAGIVVDKSPIGAQAEALADALLAGQAGWIGAGAPASTPEDVLLRGASGPFVVDPPPGEGEGDLTWVLVGVGAGVAAVAATAIVVGVLVGAGAENRLEVTVDASKL